MAVCAKYRDGVEADERVFGVLAKYAPDGVMDVFASDQHNSYLKLTSVFLKHIGEQRKATDDDVKEMCRRFARCLRGIFTFKNSVTSVVNFFLPEIDRYVIISGS